MSLTLSMLEPADVSRFGWTLVHSLWEGAGVAAMLTLTLFILRRRTSQSRYVAGCIAMTLLLVAPVATFMVLKPAPQSASIVSALVTPAPAANTVTPHAIKAVGPAHTADVNVRTTVEELDRQFHADDASFDAAPNALARPTTTRIQAQQIFPWVVSLWALGVAAMSLWNLGGWMALQRLKSIGATPASKELERQMANLCKRLGLKHAVQVLESVRVRSPLVIGALKPIILFPASVVCELPVAQLESILAHELAHIRRHDYLVNLIQSVIETLLFYHPATWWISRVIRIERENCCDDIAIAVCNDRVTYASALAGIASVRASNLAVAANGGFLLARVRRVLGLPAPRQRGSAGWAVGIVGLAACLTFTVTVATPIRSRAQSPTTQPASNEPALDLLVIDADTKKPLRDTEISWRRGNKMEKVKSDASGHARVVYDKDQPYAFDITAKHAAYVQTGVHMRTPQNDPIPATFTLPIAHGTVIGGHVVNEQRQSVAHATVTLQISEPSDAEPRVPFTTSLFSTAIETDDDGNWSFNEAPKDPITVSLRLSHKDYESDSSFESFRKPPVAELRNGSSVLVMMKGMQVTGRIEDEHGKPIAGARVSVGSSGFDTHPLATTSQADGSFTLQHCRPNPQTVLVATAAGFAPNDSRFNLSADKGGITVRMSPAKAFKFLVVDHAGKPVQGAFIQVRSWHGLDIIMHWDSTTDADGHAAWADGPADVVTFAISKSGFIPSQLQHVASDSEQRVTLWQHVRVAGNVVDDATGQPIPKFNLVKGYGSAGRPGLFWERGRSSTTRTFEGGKFALTETSDRDGYGVRIEADGYLPYESNIYRKEDVAVSLDVRLKKAAPITSTLLAADGKPLAGADIVVASTSSQVMITDGKLTQQTMATRTKTDAMGRFTLSAQPGKYSIVVVHDTAYAKLSPEEIKEQVVVPAWGRIEGTTKIGLRPATDKTMAASDIRAPMSQVDHVMIYDHAKVDGQGHFVLTHVPPGKVIVGIEQITSIPGGGAMVTTVQSKRVDVTPGQVMELAFGGTGRPVIGHLAAPHELQAQIDWRAANGYLRTKIEQPKRVLPANFATLDLAARTKLNREWQESPEGKAYLVLSEKAVYLPIRVESDGSFRVEDVPEGIYTVTVSINDGQVGRFASPVKMLASGSQELTVAAMPGGRSDEPLDMGTISMSARKQ